MEELKKKRFALKLTGNIRTKQGIRGAVTEIQLFKFNQHLWLSEKKSWSIW